MRQKLLYYRMVIFYGVLFSVNALTGAIIASFMNVSWSQIDATSKFLIVVAVIQIWTGTMLAFLNKTMARVAEDKPIIETGDTAPPFTKEPKQTINK